MLNSDFVVETTDAGVGNRTMSQSNSGIATHPSAWTPTKTLLKHLAAILLSILLWTALTAALPFTYPIGDSLGSGAWLTLVWMYIFSRLPSFACTSLLSTLFAHELMILPLSRYSYVRGWVPVFAHFGYCLGLDITLLLVAGFLNPIRTLLTVACRQALDIVIIGTTFGNWGPAALRHSRGWWKRVFLSISVMGFTHLFWLGSVSAESIRAGQGRAGPNGSIRPG
ncbi:uncharacterized protein BJ171DRAFT_518585 [Polychytrium aggregatum]|uniref:uncharacterized protein n=1 Tax=Polychytrium aggregatum TaxID=110093 RepID=UPI0022FEBD7B|nr:uncharacterized protein BJ171DRAFT_518585 [Polychytrium aggregatum]KAI9199511.1 hypothetical protein BJ171DRAFT_518585 [Polychytrium aggregatum]